MKKNLFITSLIIAAIGALGVLIVPTQVHAYPACNPLEDLQGNVNGNNATVTNYSKNPDCTYDATLAVYDSPQEPDTYGWIGAQKKIGSKTVTVGYGETVKITVDGKLSSCWNQSDLIRGNDVWDQPYYRNAMDTDVYRVSCGGETPTPTCTPSVTTTPTPTPTGTLTPTPTTTPGPTATPGPSATPTPTSAVAGALASTGNLGFIYLLVAAGAISLISGMVLKKFSK